MRHKEVRMPNRLIKETSPYLLQHADNPVDWYPWGDEALAHARKENEAAIQREVKKALEEARKDQTKGGA